MDILALGLDQIDPELVEVMVKWLSDSQVNAKES